MHWPSPFARGDALFPKEDGKIQTGDTDYINTWKAMEATLKTGKTKAIGVSNFSKAELQRLLDNCNIVPAAHQMEVHPWLQQHDFVQFNKTKGIHIQQYSPFGNTNYGSDESGEKLGKTIEDPTLVEIGKKYGKNGAQVALAWGIQSGHSVLPKSKTPARIKSNLEGDFKLEREDMERINSIDKKLRFNDVSANYGWNFFTDLEGKR